MAADLPCPQCGAAIAFRSVDLPVRVCSYCRTSVLRDDAGVRAMGTAALVPDDVSPLQLGVRGRDGDAGFELIGRLRLRWADGGWNEWLALFDDGSYGWLGEAMGRLMLLRPCDLHALHGRLADQQTVTIGEQARIDGTTYTVVDSRLATVVGSEGELPFPAPSRPDLVSIDLHAGDGRCASLQRERGKTELFTGRYVTPAELRLTNLRAFDGWPMPRWAA